MKCLKAFPAERAAVRSQYGKELKSSWRASLLLLITMGLAWSGGVNAQEPQQAPSSPSANEQSQPGRSEDSRLVQAERLNQQAMTLYGEGRYRDALSIATQVLAIYEKVLGAEHLFVATALNNLASVYRAQGQHAAAEPLYERALAIYEKVLGAEHPLVATALSNLASLYQAQGQYAAAQPLLERALAIREKVLGVEHSDVATALNNLASLYQARGQYAAAQPLYERALAIYEKVLDAEHPLVATELNNLASLYQAQGQYAAAQPLLKRALAIREKVLGAEHPDVATSLSILALLYRAQGQYAAAEPLLRRALAISEKVLGAEHPDVATALNNLALLYQAQGQYATAQPLLKRALAIYEKVLGAEHPDVAMALNNLASLYRDQGQYAAAEPLFKRALAILEKALEPEHPNVATALNNLAELYRDQGQYAAAEPLYKGSLAIREKSLGPEHPDVATALNNLAELYRAQGQYAAAELLYKRALAILEKSLGTEHPDVATALSNLALLYQAQGQYAAAEPLLKRALAIREKVLGAEHPDVATALNNLALLYRAQGQYAAAQPLYKRALAIYEKVLGAEHPDVATALNNLALLYRAQGQYAAAQHLFKRSLAICEKVLGAEHPVVATALNNLAILRWSMNDLSGAVDLAARAAEIQEHNLSIQLVAGSERQKRQYLDTLYSTLDMSVNLHLGVAPSDAKAADLALTTVLRRKGRALDAMTDQIASLRRHLAPSDRALLDELANQRNQLATLILKGPGSADVSAYRAQISALEARAQELEQKIASRSTSFAAQTQPVTIDRVRKALPAGAALVEWVTYQTFNPKAKSNESWGKSHYAAYVLMSEGEIRSVDLGETKLIDHAIGDFGEALANPGTFNELAVKRAGRALDELVMRPIRAWLGNTTHLLVAPDSELNLLPFAALVDEQGRYLLERYSITYLTSGRDLLRMQDRGDSRSAPLAMANPAFDLGGVTTVALAPATDGARGRRSGDLPQRWDPLKGTAQEAAAMKKLMSRMQVLEGRSATESALKRVAGPEMLHIATHGFFLPDQPPAPPSVGTGTAVKKSGNPAAENPLLRSGLVLAGANGRNGGGGEDGILTALEAAGLDLWGTKLVVLSACETGLGQAKSGDGVYGLRRSLVLAGAESQLISLWQVDDKATRDLMIDYYQRLLAGGGRGEALRQVQLGMLKNPELRHPNYWSAFIPIGDWRNLKGQDR